MAVGLAKALDSKKGLNIKVLKTQELTTLAVSYTHLTLPTMSCV